MSATLKEMFFFLGLVWSATLTPGRAKQENKNAPDHMLVIYPMEDFPEFNREEIHCKPQDKTEVKWIPEDGDKNLQHLQCEATDDNNYKIYLPQMSNASSYWPRKLTITVNKGENVIVPLERFPKDMNELLWQIEPIKRNKEYWQEASINATGEVSLPSFNESALVYFSKKEIGRSVIRRSSALGTVAVLVRECKKDRYGDGCEGWCPDCLYGGVCHAETGKCMCPPGRTGEFCQTACAETEIGQNCEFQSLRHEGQLYCFPSPYGCSCGPGFKGFRCDEECDSKHWGVECQQTCNHCKSGHCTDPATGECFTGRDHPCAGGPTGMRRLKRKPEIKPFPYKADVTFIEEFDGELPDGASQTGFQIVYWKNNQDISQGKLKNITNCCYTTLNDLIPGTEYQLAIYTITTVMDEHTCIENGSMRGGRIHVAHFMTTCPKDLPTPTNVQVFNITASSFIVSWDDTDYCKINYNLVIREGTEITRNRPSCGDTASREIKDLRSYTNYAITLQSVEMCDSKTQATGVTKTIRTLPLLPEPPNPTLKEVKGQQLEASWKDPEDAEGVIFYQYRWRIDYLACKDTGSFTTWSDNYSSKSVDIDTIPPYSSLVFELRIGNEAGVNPKEEKSVIEIDRQEVPENIITQVYCKDELCHVRIEEDCKKINDKDMAIAYKFESLNDAVKEYEKKSNLRTTIEYFRTRQESDYYWTVDYPLNLLPFSEYVIRAFVRNQNGINDRNQKTSESFFTKAVAPNVVNNMEVLSAQNSLTVEWDPPSRWPPTGELESYKITWRQDGLMQENEGNTTQGSYVIDLLETNKTYHVSVYAKNKGVEEYSQPENKTAVTIPHKPRPPVNISYNSTLTEISVGWKIEDKEEQQSNSKMTYKYVLSDRSNGATTETQLKFTNLRPETNYTLRLSVCNQYKCSDEVKHLLATLPHDPVVENILKVKEATGNTSEIHLPRVSNPPAWQYIVVMEDTKLLDDESVQNLSHKIVEEYKKEESSLSRAKRNAVENSMTPSGWVAGSVFVKDDSPSTNEKTFVIGDGTQDNKQLEENKEYKVVVVTEKKSGRHISYAMTKPVDARGSPPGVSGLVGIIFGVLVFLALLVLFLWSYRKKQGPIIIRAPAQQEESMIPASGALTQRSQPRPHSDNRFSFVRPLSQPRSNSGFTPSEEESDYANLRKHIPFEEIEGYLSRAIHSGDIDSEFDSVPSNVGKSCTHGEHPENRPKNRYRNNLPYNDTRVRLPRLSPQDPFSDYINANYIQGHLRKNAYIATQGPKDANTNKDTIGDFWRMIWHTESETIVMVANLVETGKIKVAQYWPEEQPILRNGLEINLISSEVQFEFIIRKFAVKRGEVRREVTQYQYTAWPDHGVPLNLYGLTQMVCAIRSKPKTRPIVVHCSAGIGQTGTILLVLSVLDQVDTSYYMDALDVLKTLRNCRPRLVENAAQYRLGHKLLQEILCGEKTSFPCSDFEMSLKELRIPKEPDNLTAIQKEFQKVKNLPKDFTYKFAKKASVAQLNRDPNILPADCRQVYLKIMNGVEESQYINAVWVRSIDQKNAYIAAEHPESHTRSNMWRLIYEKRITVWSLIHSFPEESQEFPSVLPRNGEEMIGGYLVTATDSNTFDNFTEHFIKMKKLDDKSTTDHKCVVVMMKCWLHTDTLPSSPMPLLAVMERAQSLTTASSPGLFSCKDGVTGCGVVMALLQVVGRMQLLQEVDVYRSVLGITYDRPEFIVSEEQYDLLHEAAAVYLSAYSHYSNFC